MSKGFPIWYPFRVNDLPGLTTIKQFDKLLIHGPRLRMREPTVLVKDRSMAPLLQFAKTTNKTSCPVLALVAMDQDRVIPTIQQYRQRRTDLVIRD